MGETFEQRILTIPNFLSLLRLLALPVFLWLLFGRHDRWYAAVVLGAMGATDWVDGYVARHFNQESTLGKILDPTADRLVLLVGVIAIMVDGSVPAWLAAATIGREALVGLVAIALAAAGARRIDVQWVGKAGTFALLWAFPLLLAGRSGITWHTAARTLGWCSAIPGLMLSYYAAITYVPLARRALADGRRERRVGSQP